VVDVLGMCFFPRQNQWIAIETFGRPIPMFMVPVYSWFVGGQAILVWHLLRRGMDRRQFWTCWFAIMAVDVVLETPGLLMNVYTYYGSQPFNPWGLPLWWAPVNATMPVVAGYLVYRMYDAALRPMADGIANAATAGPVWATLNTNLGMAATYPAAILTFGLAAMLVWVIALRLPAAAPVDKRMVPATGRVSTSPAGAVL